MSTDAIDGVALADAAEVHAHALPLQKRRARAVVDLDVAIVDERQAFFDLPAVGDAIVLVLVVELPQARQRGEGDVEAAVGPLADLARHAQHLARFGADGNGMVAGRLVEANDVAAVASTRSSSRRGDRTRRRRPQTPPRPASRRTSTPSGVISVPIAGCVRSTRWAAGAGTGLRPHAAVSAPDTARAQAARRTAIVTARARRTRELEAGRRPCVCTREPRAPTSPRWARRRCAAGAYARRPSFFERSAIRPGRATR